jgi:hypothetical protein
MEQIIRMALRLLLSATFLLSAYTKAIDFSAFEVRLLDTGLFGWSLTPWIAAAFIVLEYLIGFAFLMYRFKTRWLFPFTWGILVLFSVYLLVLLATKGNNVNCGCMGETLSFTPWQAIVKNVLSMLILGLLQFFESRQSFESANWNWHILLLFLATVSSWASIPSLYTEKALPLESKSYFDRHILSTHGFNNRNLEKETGNKRLYAFLSMSCGHCQVAAERLGSIQKSTPLPISLVINGDSLALDAFLQEHNIYPLPVRMLGAQPFMQLAGTHLPAIFIVENDSITHQLRLFNLNGGLLQRLLQ